jgi:uncharacterized membrane protein YgcG
MKTNHALAALGAALMLSACEHSGGGLNMHRFESPDFGDSVRSNIAAESVPADPDGARQSLAQQRYHTDRVKQPPTPATSSVSTGGGSSTEGTSSGGGGTGTTGGGGY